MDDGAEILNCLDTMIGRAFTDFALHEDKTHHMVKITFTCRACRNPLSMESSYVQPGWSVRFLEAILERAKRHSKLHQTKLILPTKYTN